MAANMILPVVNMSTNLRFINAFPAIEFIKSNTLFTFGG